MEDISYKAILSEWPHTRQMRDDRGRMTVVVADRVIGPGDVKWAEGMTSATMVLLSIGLFALLCALTPPVGFWMGSLGAVMVLIVPVQKFWWRAYETEFTFYFTPESFSTGSGPAYDLRVPHRFSTALHSLAQEEARQIEFKIRAAQQNRQVINPKRYYADSYHLIFKYDGYSHFLLEIYGKWEAERLGERLRSVAKYMAHQRGIGQGEAVDPEDEWGRASGDLPG